MRKPGHGALFSVMPLRGSWAHAQAAGRGHLAPTRSAQSQWVSQRVVVKLRCDSVTGIILKYATENRQIHEIVLTWMDPFSDDGRSTLDLMEGGSDRLNRPESPCYLLVKPNVPLDGTAPDFLLLLFSFPRC